MRDPAGLTPRQSPRARSPIAESRDIYINRNENPLGPGKAVIDVLLGRFPEANRYAFNGTVRVWMSPTKHFGAFWPATAGAQSITEFPRLYEQRCARCHDSTAAADPQPPNRQALMQMSRSAWAHIKAPTLAFGGAEDRLAGTAAVFQQRMKYIADTIPNGNGHLHLIPDLGHARTWKRRRKRIRRSSPS